VCTSGLNGKDNCCTVHFSAHEHYLDHGLVYWFPPLHPFLHHTAVPRAACRITLWKSASVKAPSPTCSLQVSGIKST
jgi:hypothetical protein